MLGACCVIQRLWLSGVFEKVEILLLSPHYEKSHFKGKRKEAIHLQQSCSQTSKTSTENKAIEASPSLSLTELLSRRYCLGSCCQLGRLLSGRITIHNKFPLPEAPDRGSREEADRPCERQERIKTEEVCRFWLIHRPDLHPGPPSWSGNTMQSGGLHRYVAEPRTGSHTHSDRLHQADYTWTRWFQW